MNKLWSNRKFPVISFYHSELLFNFLSELDESSADGYLRAVSALAPLFSAARSYLMSVGPILITVESEQQATNRTRLSPLCQVLERNLQWLSCPALFHHCLALLLDTPPYQFTSGVEEAPPHAGDGDLSIIPPPQLLAKTTSFDTSGLSSSEEWHACNVHLALLHMTAALERSLTQALSSSLSYHQLLMWINNFCIQYS